MLEVEKQQVHMLALFTAIWTATEPPVGTIRRAMIDDCQEKSNPVAENTSAGSVSM